MMPWIDLWGTLVAVAISSLLAWTAFENGRHAYRPHLWFCGGNLIISLAVFWSEGGWVPGGWWGAIYFLGISVISYFAVIGALTIFRLPKRVKCFRCEYVDWPHETKDARTPYDEAEWRNFRRMHTDGERRREAIAHKSDVSNDRS